MRRTGGFRAWFAAGKGWTALSPLDISASGMGFISPVKFDTDEINIRVMLDGKAILLRAKEVWCIQGASHGKPVWRYGVRYTGIAADDWSALVHFCSNEAVDVENNGQKELELIPMRADDVERLIPQRLQDRLLSMLVDARRLAPLEKDKIPLAQFFYGGTVKRGARQVHRLSIHSRVVDELEGDARAYDTRFVFDDNGTDIDMEIR